MSAPGRRRGRARARARRPPAQHPASRAHWRVDGSPKTRFSSEDDANRAAFGARLDHGVDLSVYRCEVCGGWHLGNTPD